MGRAIDMEKRLDIAEAKILKLENSLNYIMQTATTRKNVDIIEETRDAKKESNNEADGKSSRKPNTRKSASRKKSS
tara:strand:- start:361 stop:588 length:228 start_codon:yes stop_codon:yes gene_type:complete